MYGFDDAGRHIWTKYALGGATKYAFTYSTTQPSQLIAVTDATGKVTNIAYGANSVIFKSPFSDGTAAQWTTLTLTNGYATNVRYQRAAGTFEDYVMAYTVGGLLQSFRKPGNATASLFTYDAFGRLASDKDPTMTGATTLAVTTTDRGRQVDLKTADNHVYSGKFETLADGGAVTSLTDPAGVITTTAESLDGVTTRTELGGELITRTEPGDAGPRFGTLAPENVTERTLIAGNAHQAALEEITTTSTSATVPGDVFSTTSLNQTVTRTGKIGGVTQTAMEGTWTTTTNVASGVATTTTTSPTVSGWDARTVETVVDARHRVTSTRVPGYPSGTGLTTAFTYGLDTDVCSAPPVNSTTGCNGRLLAINVSAPGETTRTTTLSYGYKPILGYDPGYVSSILDPENYRTTYGSWSGSSLTATGRDALGRVTKVTRSRDAVTPQWITDLGYDLNGNVNAVTPPHDAGVPTHALVSNGIDLLSSYTPPDAGLATNVTSYQYNQERAVTSRVEPWDGTTRSLLFGYDTFGRLSTTTDAIAGTTLTVGYDTVGRPVSYTTTGGAAAITLGEVYAGRLGIQTTYSNAVTAVLMKHYDHGERLVRRRLKTPTGPELNVEMTYAPDGLVQNVRTRKVADTADDATLVITGRNAIAARKTATVKRADGSTALNETWTYNGFGELMGYTVQDTATPTPNTLYQMTGVTRDKLGRITAMTETVASVPGPGTTSTTWAFVYDDAGRLTRSTKAGVNTDYVYDANGNRVSSAGTTATYDVQDRLSTFGATSYAWNNNGSLKSTTVSSQTTNYTYDLAGNLRTYAPPSATASTYVIDGKNRRVSQLLGGTAQRSWVYDDQLRIAAELDGGGKFTHIFAYGEGGTPEMVFEPDTSVNPPTTGKSYRVISDWRGSVRLVVDISPATPVARQRVDYDPWGVRTETLNTTGDANFKALSIGFAGGLLDRATGFVRFGARDYDPGTGRWTNKDPIRFDGGLNLYAYVADEPVNRLDRTGLYPLMDPLGNPIGGDSDDPDPSPPPTTAPPCDPGASSADRRCVVVERPYCGKNKKATCTWACQDEEGGDWTRHKRTVKCDYERQEAPCEKNPP